MIIVRYKTESFEVNESFEVVQLRVLEVFC